MKPVRSSRSLAALVLGALLLAGGRDLRAQSEGAPSTDPVSEAEADRLLEELRAELGVEPAAEPAPEPRAEQGAGAEAGADPAAAAAAAADAQERVPVGVGSEPSAAPQPEPALPALAEGLPAETLDPRGLGSSRRTGGEPTVGDREYLLSLREALDLALGSNLALEIESVATDVRSFEARGSRGAFDWVVSATGRYTDGEQQGSSQLSGANVLEFDNQDFLFDLSKPLTTGGDIGFNYNRNNLKTNNQFTLVNPSPTDNLGVTYNQPLLRRGWSEFATADQRSADVRLEQQRERERQVRQQLVRDVHDAYWDVVGAYEQLAVARSNVDLGLEQLDQNRRRLSAGVGTEVEVLQAQAEVASRRESLLAAQVAVRDAGDALKRLLFPRSDVELWELRIVPTTSLPKPSEVTPNAAPPWTDCLVQALEQRSDLRQQRMTIEVAEIAHGKSLNERQVGLDLQLSAASQSFDGDASEAFSSVVQYEFPTYSAALTFSTPIGNRTARFAERAAWAAVRRAKLEYDQIEIQAAAEVRSGVRQVVYQAERVIAAGETLRLAQRQLDAERARLAEGLSTNFVVLQFQQALAPAESSERRARVDYMKALAALAAARGVIGEVP